MKYLRFTARPDASVAPTTFRLLADSEYVDLARTVALTVAGRESATFFARVTGDRRGLVPELRAAPEVVLAEATPADSGTFYLLVILDPEAVPPVGSVFETLAHTGLVVVPPVTYRNGAVHARLVGRSEAVGSVVENLPSFVDVEIHEVGERGLTVDSGASALSDRQREAVYAALELGYYDQPRRATHEDVADAIGCAPSTASEHLRKAEATLIRAAMD